MFNIHSTFFQNLSVFQTMVIFKLNCVHLCHFSNNFILEIDILLESERKYYQLYHDIMEHLHLDNAKELT